MPTFETDVTAKKQNLKADEFRPRKRGDWYGTLEETFAPTPIPVEVKQAIDRRISELMRKTRGPDETMYSIRGWLSTAKKVIVNLPTIVKDVILRRKDEEDDEEEIEEEEEAMEESENNSSDVVPVAAQPSGEQRSRRKHRHHSGGRGNYNRDGRDYRRDNGDRREED
jgi:hypothetical protein